MSTAKDAKKFAMALHGVSEIDHFGRPAFRTEKRIFLVIRPDGLNILLPEERKEFLFAAASETFVKKMWGKRPYMVAQPEYLSVTELKALIEEAHAFSAPAKKKVPAKKTLTRKS